MAKAVRPRPMMPHEWEPAKPKMPEDLEELHSAALLNVRCGDLGKKEWLPEPVRAYYAARAEERAGVQAAWDEHKVRCDDLSSQFDCKRLEKEFDERHNDLWVIGYRIFETPANTIEGMAVKLRVGETLDTHHCE